MWDEGDTRKVIKLGSGINNNVRVPYHFLEKMKIYRDELYG
jgi:hypothetical protein